MLAPAMLHDLGFLPIVRDLCQINSVQGPFPALRGLIRARVLVFLGVLAGWHGQLLAAEFVRAPGPYPQGLTTDGQFLWVADYQTRAVFRLDTDGRIISSFISLFGRPRGLAHHGETLYVATVDRIIGVDADTGRQISELASPDPTDPDHQGLAYGNGMIWVASRGDDDRIFGIDPGSGQVSVSFPAPGNNPRGLTFYDDSLWNMDSSDGMIYRVSPLDGLVLAAFPCPLADGRGLTHYQGAFVQADASLRQLARFDTAGQFADVYIPTNRFNIPNSDWWVPCVTSHPFDELNRRIRRIVLFQPGVGDNAVQYFALAREASRRAGLLEDTVVVSLQFLDDAKFNQPPPPGLLYWTSGRFWGGLSAESSPGSADLHRLSSFDVLDRFLEELAASTGSFPNLQEIVIGGHSGGGQLVNRYAAVGRFDGTPWLAQRGITVRYVAMNAGSYLYFNSRRYDPATSDPLGGFIRFESLDSPPDGYNDYGYGLENLLSYPSGTGAETIQSRYPLKDVAYLIGELDTDDDYLDATPEAMVQGRNRYERGLVYYAHLHDHFSASNLDGHELLTVAGVGHDAFAMITSPEGLQSLFRELPDVPKIEFDRLGGRLEIHWNNNGILQTSDALGGEWQDVPDATSPHRVNSDSRPSRFYRTRRP